MKTKIGDVEVEQNYFVQSVGTYPIILGQPYIMVSRIKTKVQNDGSHYASIWSSHDKRSIQLLTERYDHEKHWDQL